MTEFVLDASAVLALFYEESGAEMVAQSLSSSVLSSANAAEIVTRLIRDGLAPRDASARVQLLHCPIEPVDERVGLRAGELFVQTRGKGLSLGDRLCLAFAESRRLPVLTADRAWRDLDLDVEVILIR